MNDKVDRALLALVKAMAADSKARAEQLAARPVAQTFLESLLGEFLAFEDHSGSPADVLDRLAAYATEHARTLREGFTVHPTTDPDIRVVDFVAPWSAEVEALAFPPPAKVDA